MSDDVDFKGMAEATVSSVDAAMSNSSVKFDAEDWDSKQVQTLVDHIITVSASSRAELKGIRAGGVVFEKLGQDPRTQCGKWKEVPLAASGDFDAIEFVFRPRQKETS